MKYIKLCVASSKLLGVLFISVLFGGTCITSINLCGTVFTFCEPVDQLNLMFPYLEMPDYGTDPSCTIPLGCGDGDVLPPLEGSPGGGTPDAPTDNQGGFGSGGGGI